MIPVSHMPLCAKSKCCSCGHAPVSRALHSAMIPASPALVASTLKCCRYGHSPASRALHSATMPAAPEQLYSKPKCCSCGYTPASRALISPMIPFSVMLLSSTSKNSSCGHAHASRVLHGAMVPAFCVWGMLTEHVYSFPNPCFCPTCDSKKYFMTFTAKCRTRCDSGGIPFAAIREGSCRKLATILHTSSGRPIPVTFWSSVQNVPGFMHHENTWSGVSCPIPWYYTTVTGGSKHWSVEPKLTTRRQIVADNAFHWSCALRLAPL